MRTTITFDDDVASAVRRIQRERGVGISEAVNDLARAGLAAKSAPKRFQQRTADLGLKSTLPTRPRRSSFSTDRCRARCWLTSTCCCLRRTSERQNTNERQSGSRHS